MLTWHYTSPFGSVMFPMEHRRALEQEAERTGTHKTQTSSLSLTESWCRSFGKEHVRNLRRRRDALFGIIDNWVILIGLIVRGSTRRYRHELNQVHQDLGVGFIVSEKARDA